MIVNRLDREKHWIREHGLVVDLRERLKEPNLFACYMPEAQTWSVCVWVRKEHGLFVEVLVLKNIRDFGREEFETLDRWVHNRGPTVQDAKRQMAEDEKRQLLEMQAEDEAALDAKQFIGRRLGDSDNPEWSNPGFRVKIGR